MIKEVNLTELQTPAKKGHAEIVEDLEFLLKEARQGKIEAIAVATVNRDDGGDTTVKAKFNNGYCGNCFELIASVEFLRRALLDYQTSGQ